MERVLTYDWRGDNPPGPGDVLTCVRRRDGGATGTCYLILTAREVKRRDPVPGVVRMHYRVVRVVAWERGTRQEPLVWNKR